MIYSNASDTKTPRYFALVHLSRCTGSFLLKFMEQFVVGQKWIMADAVFGTFVGGVVEISDDGISGTVVITDDQGNIVDTFTGTAAEFQRCGEWCIEE